MPPPPSSTHIEHGFAICRASLVVQMVKNLLVTQEIRVQSLGQEGPLKEEMATHSSILAWRISWTEESGGLQSMGSQRRTGQSDKHFLSNHLEHLLSDLSYCPVTKSCRFVHHVHVLLETEGSYELRTSAFSKFTSGLMLDFQTGAEYHVLSEKLVGGGETREERGEETESQRKCLMESHLHSWTKHQKKGGVGAGI